MRPLGIPNVRDRIAQMATLLVLEPIFEADLPDSAFGFRPGRHAKQALDRIARFPLRGPAQVVDADLASYFDTISRENLLKLTLLSKIKSRKSQMPLWLFPITRT
jgi:RNA-directed DNA polymerase